MTTTLVLLGLIGVLTMIHSICLATAVPQYAPMEFGLATALMFSAGIAAVVFAIGQDLEASSRAVFAIVVLQVLYLGDATRRRYKVVGLAVIDYKPQPQQITTN